MNFKCKTLLAIIIIFFRLDVAAQHRKCKTMELRQQRMNNNPALRAMIEDEEQNIQNNILALPRSSESQIISIPVVIHVLYHNGVENISDAQIQSQLDVLNQDFRMTNADTLPYTHPFATHRADSRITFYLAQTDPNGNSTNGIIRTYTDSTSFVGWGYEKFSQTGGHDGWNPNNYLNIWVCNLGGSGGVLGYATFPSDLSTYPDEDGVVINYENFGDTGTVVPPFHLGRTLTHEVGHWLNLRHIWGDDDCGNDLVSDTPTADSANYGCPSFPKDANNSCGADSNGEMFMNYMDYVDDSCMNMFTAGQVNRMSATLNSKRRGWTSINRSAEVVYNDIQIYPNPTSGIVFVSIKNIKLAKDVDIDIFNLVGEKIAVYANVYKLPAELNLSEFAKGVYFITINSGDYKSTQKIILD
jgi:hypothetical protein